MAQFENVTTGDRTILGYPLSAIAGTRWVTLFGQLRGKF